MQAVELMQQWVPIDVADALELLSPDFKNDEVRAHAGEIWLPHPWSTACSRVFTVHWWHQVYKTAWQCFTRPSFTWLALN
jgi:hypothetical protein